MLQNHENSNKNDTVSEEESKSELDNIEELGID